MASRTWVQVVTLAAACVTTLSAGTIYIFSAYGPQLATRLSLSSTKTNIIGAAGNVGCYVTGPLVGILVDRTGPRPTLVGASISLFIGYTLIRSIYDSGEVSMAGLILGEFLVGVGSSCAITAAGNGVAKSFDGKRRGSAMGLVYAGFGLSAFFYSALSHAEFLAGENHTSTFLLILSVGCGVSCGIGAIYVRPALHVPVAGGYRSLAEDERPPLPSSPAPSLQYDVVEEEEEREEARLRKEAEHRKAVDVSGRRLFCHPDFWILFCITGLCSGSGLMVINNLGTIIKTLAYAEADPKDILVSQAYLVSLLSIFNCLGRLLSGFMSDFFLHHAPITIRFDRAWWLVLMSAMFVLSQILIGSTYQVEGWIGLAIPTAITGLAYGSLFGLLPTLVLEWFGMLNFGQNIGYITLSPVVFANFANIAFGRLYDAQVIQDPSADTPKLLSRAGAGMVDHLCLKGRECFSMAFHLTTLMTLVGVALSVWVGRRRSIYGHVTKA